MTYNTKDLALAGFLLTYGFPLMKADRDDQEDVVFHFDSIPDLPAIAIVVTAYQTGKAIVEPKTFYQNTKLLKTVIYGGYKRDTAKR